MIQALFCALDPFDMFKKHCIIIFLLLIQYSVVQAQNTPFKILPLGVKGGEDESNLSAYMVAPQGSDNYVCFDAGTINAGIQKAIKRGVFKGLTEEVQRSHIKGYLISHGHLDHLSGLVINSPADSPKHIYGLAPVLHILRDKYFSWDAWANFANEGEAPQLKKYTYMPLEEGKSYPLAETEMTVQAYQLSHVNPYLSTAFLVKSGDSYVLYLGDTGADEIEKSTQLHKLWTRIAPLIKAGQLKAILLEVSFPNEQAENLLFGHLTPKLFFQELNNLSALTDSESMKAVSIVVTHVKPPETAIKTIKKQLKLGNTMGLKLIFPEQGRLIQLN